jgi:hypothetical protein
MKRKKTLHGLFLSIFYCRVTAKKRQALSLYSAAGLINKLWKKAPNCLIAYRAESD